MRSNGASASSGGAPGTITRWVPPRSSSTATFRVPADLADADSAPEGRRSIHVDNGEHDVPDPHWRAPFHPVQCDTPARLRAAAEGNVMTRSTRRRVDLLVVTAGAIRMASGVSFLVAPEAANRLWGDDEDSGPDGEPPARGRWATAMR